MSDPASTRAAVAQAFAQAAFDALATDGHLQAESAIAGMARMAGTYYFRTFGYAAMQLQPGQAVLSAEANEKGPELMNLTHALLERLGLRINDAEVRRTLAATQEAHKPVMDFASTQLRLERAFAPIKAQYGLSNEDAGKAAACATALLIHNCQQVLAPAIGFGIAVYAFVEGTKTTPWPLPA
ncbi:MAG: hypothetical protein V4729_10620 [Pseudomonadota bacterium]